MTIRTEQQEYLADMKNRIEEKRASFDALVREHTSDNDAETLVRVENAMGAAAPKGEALDALVAEAESTDPDDWEDVRERVDAAWIEYREVLDRARRGVERVEESG